MSRRLIKHEYLKNLVEFTSNTSDLHDYFQSLSNSYSEVLEKDFYNKNKKSKNDLSSIELQKQNQNAHVEKNMFHCGFCKINYFNKQKQQTENNVKVFLKPKCYLSNQNAKLLTKHKLYNKKFKYNSYKQRLVQKIIKNSVQVFYKCKKCKSNNLIFKEKQRNNLEKIKLITSRNVKTKNNYDLLINKSKSLIKSSSETTSASKKQKNFLRNKKFQSLKLAVENDSKQKASNNTSIGFGGSLSDFLEKMK
jgi:hypothetical protein